MKLLLIVVALVELLDTSFAARQGIVKRRLNRFGGGTGASLLADSHHGFLSQRATGNYTDLGTAFLMFTTEDDFFIDTEKKSPSNFSYSTCQKLSQVTSVPWTRFGVFMSVYNSTDRTVLPGLVESCYADELKKIVCKVVN